jgi:hypothetical protein
MKQFDNGIDADKPKQEGFFELAECFACACGSVSARRSKQEGFFELAECFRSATDPEEVRRLGDQIGRTGGMHRWMQKIFDGSP